MTPWPELDYATVAPTADHLHRLAQIAGKYTLDQPFEFNWGNILFPVGPRGFATPTLAADEASFTIAFDLLDDEVRVEADTGRVALPLMAGTVAGFLHDFVATVEPLGIPAPGSLSQPEIEGAPALDEDTEHRPYDPEAAGAMAGALARVATAFRAYQGAFRGPRPPVGLYWGGFDVSATRFNGRLMDPPTSFPMFHQNAMTGELVAVGFSFGSEASPAPGFYAYLAPPPAGLDTVDFGEGAAWLPDAGLVVLPWDAVRAAPDPQAKVVDFADRVYAAAGWPDELVGERVDGWHAARHPVWRS